MYRFQISAQTQKDESIGLVGSVPELGSWNVEHCVRMQTSGDRYPRWWAEVDFGSLPAGTASIEYKYVRFEKNGGVEWEAWGENRWVPHETQLPSILVVEDGSFGVLPPCPYGYFVQPAPSTALPRGERGLKVVVIGSSVAVGCNAWLLRGWSTLLEQELHQQFGHQLVNLSEIGANISTTIDRFPRVVPPENPDIVIVALSLGNEGLAYCQPYERRAVQRRFESGLRQLVKMIRELGALPLLGGVYPNGDYQAEHAWLLQDTHRRMLTWGVPVFNWLPALEDGSGRWKPGLSSDVAHPNGAGHRLMFETVRANGLHYFQIDPEEMAQRKQQLQQRTEIPVFHDNQGFHVFACADEKHVRIINTSSASYRIHPDWHALQTALQHNARLLPGLYIPQSTQQSPLPCFSVQADGRIETTFEVPPASDLEYTAAFHLFSPSVSEILFYDGSLGILKESPERVRVINESDHEYNIQPMWKEIRRALQVMPNGVYEDTQNPDAPFRTLMIGNDGLESRVKVPAKSSVVFDYRCKLSDISRVAILPLGDRCAVRMLLYKMEYDGPAFPFDLTRTTNLADVADIIETGFQDMWNPQFLHYNGVEKRIYHGKWTGLSFAHEVEDTENPDHDMSPVHRRMRDRYSSRANRFWYTLQHCDKVLFVRTGGTQRSIVIDLLSKLEKRCQGKPFRLLLISLQDSQEFADLPNVLHYNLEFNPDRMYEDLGHWLYCTDIMRDILHSLGVSSKNLFWCPPSVPPTAPTE